MSDILSVVIVIAGQVLMYVIGRYDGRRKATEQLRPLAGLGASMARSLGRLEVGDVLHLRVRRAASNRFEAEEHVS